MMLNIIFQFFSREWLDRWIVLRLLPVSELDAAADPRVDRPRGRRVLLARGPLRPDAFRGPGPDPEVLAETLRSPARSLGCSV